MYRKISTLLPVSMAVCSVPAIAHDGSEQSSIMSGIIHFMTEPDHLFASGIIAAALIFSIRKIASKRS